MKKILDLIGKIKNIFIVQRNYFSESGEEIAVRNLNLVRTMSYAAIVIYIVYYILTMVFFRDKAIDPIYCIIIPVLFLFLHFCRKTLKLRRIRSKIATRITLLAYIFTMLYIIALSVFPHPDMPSVYYPLFLMMAPVIFIIPAYQLLLVTLSSQVIFYILVLNFKSPECWSHELFEATTAAVFSAIVVMFMAQSRIQTDNLKTKYFNLSRSDALTGTMNKATGLAAAQKFLDDIADDRQCAVYFLDIDNFKMLNDTYGHMEGDRLLKCVGDSLNIFCGEKGIVSRFGGDEFIILMKNINGADGASRIAEQITEAIHNADKSNKHTLNCSIGLCISDKSCRNISELVKRADIALYEAKSNGKNMYYTFKKA